MSVGFKTEKRIVVKTAEGDYGILGVVEAPFAWERTTEVGRLVLSRVERTYVLYRLETPSVPAVSA